MLSWKSPATQQRTRLHFRLNPKRVCIDSSIHNLRKRLEHISCFPHHHNQIELPTIYNSTCFLATSEIITMNNFSNSTPLKPSEADHEALESTFVNQVLPMLNELLDSSDAAGDIFGPSSSSDNDSDNDLDVDIERFPRRYRPLRPPGSETIHSPNRTNSKYWNTGTRNPKNFRRDYVNTRGWFSTIPQSTWSSSSQRVRPTWSSPNGIW